MANRYDSHLRKLLTVCALFGVAPLMLPPLSQRSLADAPGDRAGPDYDLSWFTIDGGGPGAPGFSAGGDFDLSGTVGQSDASDVLAGRDFELTGGFWFRIPRGDCEDDGDVDLNDFEAFEDCLTGPNVVVGDACRCFDVDRNGAVDLADLATVQANFTSQ